MNDRRENLLDAARVVDVLDVAGRIIARPERNAINATVAEVTALAHAVEAIWGLVLESDRLARAVLAVPNEDGVEAVRQQARTVRNMMDALTGNNEGDQ